MRTDAGIIVRTESVKKTRAGASRYAAIGGFDRSDPEQLAEALSNASLIAAAPELLEALIELADEVADRFDLDSPSTNPSIKHAVSSARAAIVCGCGQPRQFCSRWPQGVSSPRSAIAACPIGCR